MLKFVFACTFLHNHLLCIGNFVGSWLQNPPQACTFAHPDEPDVSHSRYPHGVVYRFCTCSFFLVRIQYHDVLKNPVFSWHFPCCDHPGTFAHVIGQVSNANPTQRADFVSAANQPLLQGFVECPCGVRSILNASFPSPSIPLPWLHPGRGKRRAFGAG